MTRTSGANSCASCRVRLIIAALLMPYAPMNGEAETPATEAMLTIAPPFSLCQAVQVCWAKPSAEITLVSKTLRADAEVQLGDRPEHRVRAGVVDQVVDAAEGLHGALDGDAPGGPRRAPCPRRRSTRSAPSCSTASLSASSLRPVMHTRSPRATSASAMP